MKFSLADEEKTNLYVNVQSTLTLTKYVEWSMLYFRYFRLQGLLPNLTADLLESFEEK